MKALKKATIILFSLTLLLGVIYPFFMWGVGQLFFHHHANGTLLLNREGKVIGSKWIGQNFASPEYFHPRPSSAGVNGYDAANSSGSNLGPTSQKWVDILKKRVNDYRSENNWDGEIPPDAITASGSGLDPHISAENARIQAPRIATARNLSQEEINRLIEEHTQGRTLGIFGERRINVLEINLALDQK